MSSALPKEMNFASNKPMSANGKPYINRYRSDNSSYAQNDTIKIEIPTGRQGSYLFPNDSFIEGKITLTATNAAAAEYFIDQSIFSIINRLRITHGGVVLEDYINFNKIITSIYDLQVNGEARRDDTITKLVYDSTTVLGVTTYDSGLAGKNFLSFDAAGGTKSATFDFAFVLPSALLGSLCSKALPVGLMGASSLYLELELVPANVAFTCSVDTGTNISYTVQDIYYNAKQTTLPNDINEMLIESTGGFINIPAVSYRSETKSVSANTTAWNDKFSYQFSSIQNFNFFFINGATANGLIRNRSVTARTKANLNDYYLTINGEAYPSQTIQNPARMMAETLRAWDMLTETSSSGVLNFSNYVDSNTCTSANDAINANGVDHKNKRFLASIDMAKFCKTQSTLMSGTSSIGQMVSLQCNFSTAPAEALNLYSFVMFDCLFHLSDGMLSPKF